MLETHWSWDAENETMCSISTIITSNYQHSSSRWIVWLGQTLSNYRVPPPRLILQHSKSCSTHKKQHQWRNERPKNRWSEINLLHHVIKSRSFVFLTITFPLLRKSQSVGCCSGRRFASLSACATIPHHSSRRNNLFDITKCLSGKKKKINKMSWHLTIFLKR